MHATQTKKNSPEQLQPDMSLGKLLQPDRVLANVEARSKKHAFEIVSELIASVSEELSHVDVFEALLERERIGNTGLGAGIAIPHGRIEDLPQAAGAFLKLSEPVDFGAQDGEPVSYIFAIAVPADDNEDHFEVIAETARALNEPRLAGMLTEVSGSRALFEILAAYIPEAPASSEDETPESD